MPSGTGNLSKERRVILEWQVCVLVSLKLYLHAIKAKLRFAMDDMTDFPTLKNHQHIIPLLNMRQ